MAKRSVFVRCFVFLFLCSFWIGTEANADSGLILKDDVRQYDLSAYMQLLSDPGGRLTAEQAAGPEMAAAFSPLQGRTPNFGYDEPVRWVRVAVRNESGRSDWVLQIQYAAFDRADLYVMESGRLEPARHSGDLVPFRDWDMHSRQPMFMLKLDPGREATLLLRLETEGSMTFPMRIVSPNRYSEIAQTNYLLLGTYYGLMLVMTLYNAILAFSLRSRKYFYYVLINLSALGLYATFNGIAYQFIWPDAVWWNNRAIVFFMCAAHASALLFARRYLELPQKLPKLSKLMVFFIALELFNMAVLGFSYPAALHLSVYSLMAVDLGLLFAACISWVKGSRAAVYLLPAWGVFLVGAILTSLADAGYIPTRGWIHYASQTGSAFEALILSWGLAHRIRQIRQEKDAAESLMQESRRLAESDELTGLHNRRYVIHAFDALVRSEPRQPVSVLLLDVDHFKRINDTLGHDAGDAVLRTMGRLLRGCFRPSDIVGRYGGEEFVVVLPDTNVAQAERAAEYLLGRVREHPFVAGGESLNCSVSIGIAAWDGRPEDGFDGVLRRADEAMYAAKHAGRGRIMVAEAAR